MYLFDSMNCRCSSHRYLAFSLSMMVLWLVSHCHNKVGEIILTGASWAWCQSSLLRSLLGISVAVKIRSAVVSVRWAQILLLLKKKLNREGWKRILVYSVVGANCSPHLRSLRLELHLKWNTNAILHVLSNLKRRLLMKPIVYLLLLRGCPLFQT